METLAYASGYAAFRWQRGRQGDVVSEPQRWTVLAAAAMGALVGSRLLGIAEQWPTVIEAWRTGRIWTLLFSPGGKTIVGGLLGGWLGVEIVKRLSGIRRRTGDLFALPLCVGIAVGRVGCLLAGLADDTYGKPTTLPWAVNLGDGIGRQPVQVYEIIFLALLAIVVSRIPVAHSVSGRDVSHPEDFLQKSRPLGATDEPLRAVGRAFIPGINPTQSMWASAPAARSSSTSSGNMPFPTTSLAPEGTRFRVFLGGYLAWRIAIDFLKPQPLIEGMNLIQWSCVAGILFLVLDWILGKKERNEQAAG